MTGTILSAFVAAGFWTTGHYQGFLYYDRAACELARPAVEEEMRGRGYIVTSTICVDVDGKG